MHGSDTAVTMLVVHGTTNVPLVEELLLVLDLARSSAKILAMEAKKMRRD